MTDDRLTPVRSVGPPPAPRERLIVALDVPRADDAMRLVDRLGNAVSFFKIGLHLALAPELHALIRELRAAQKRIFLDFKFIDIAATVAGGVAMAATLGLDFITVMGQRQIVRAAAEARGDAALKILAVTLLTGMNEEDMQDEYHTALGLSEFVERRALAAVDAGCDGVIASPREIELLRAAVATPDFLIITPGIRPRGAAQDDQRRTATPYEAIAAGADYLVVGRPIIRAAEPRDAALRIGDEIAAAFADRASAARAAAKAQS